MSSPVATYETIPLPEDDALGDEIARIAAHLDSATHRLLACVRRFDDSREWERQGALSCAHWLSWRIGLDLATAREKVRVARALGTLPKIDAALARGTLSYAKVRAMTRVATPENEERLLAIALSATGAQLEQVCRRFRRVLAVDEGGERLDERRFVRSDALASGLVRITAVLQPDEAALVMRAIEMARLQAAGGVAPESASPDVSAEEPCRTNESSGGNPPRAGASSSAKSPSLLPMADALTRVAESFLAHGEAAGCGGDRYQMVVHLDQDTLAEDGTLAATLDDGTRLSAETFRRIACDSALVPMLHGAGSEVVEVGRRTRTVSPALRRVLWARDAGCRFPGCTHRIYVHAHHIQHWAHGGSTSADNLVLLCSAHHRLVHEGGFELSGSGATIEFRDPRGGRVDPCPLPAPVPSWTSLLESNGNAGVEIDGDTNYPGWDGSPVDYGLAVSALLS